MRTRTDVFLEKLHSYLKSFFDEKCTEFGIESVKNYQIGFVNEPLSSTTEYPASLMVVTSKNGVDTYSCLFDCTVAIAVTSDDVNELGRVGLIWSDILEDAIRSDYSLGGACLDVEDGFNVMTSYADDLMIIAVEFNAEIDLGGYVYEECTATEDSGKSMQTMWLSDAESHDVGMSEKSQEPVSDNGIRKEE